METYADAYKGASRKGGTQEIGVTYHKWEAIGSQIIGMYIGCNPVTGRFAGQEYMQYMFETDNGPIKFHLGAAADRDYGPLLVVGEIYFIRYDGQEAISGGNKVNRFHVEHVDKAFLGTPPTEK